jgi:hypothetical protein
MNVYVNSYGVCNWFPEHGAQLVAPESIDAFTSLSPAGKVFYCTGIQDKWLVLQYGANIYCVSSDVFRPVATPAFKIGQQVIVGEKAGIIEHVMWHFKNEVPIYLLTFSGKLSSRRYAEAELSLPA